MRRGLCLTALFIDLDHFKVVNDRFGHERGDDVLVAMGEVIRREAAGHLLARFGGEEFVVLAQGLPTAAALELGERVRAALDRQAALPVTASVGVARGCAIDEPLSILLQRADQALYRAKAGGRDRCVAA